MRTLYESILDVDDNIENTGPWKDSHEKVIYFFNRLKSSLPHEHITHTLSSSKKSSTFHIVKSSEYNYNNNVIEISISYKLWYERGKLVIDSPKLCISNVVGDISHPIFRHYIDLNADEKFINKKTWTTTNTDTSYGNGSKKYELNIDLIEEFFQKFEKLPNLYDKLCKDIISSDIVKNTDEFKELDYSSKFKICTKILEKSLHKLLQ